MNNDNFPKSHDETPNSSSEHLRTDADYSSGIWNLHNNEHQQYVSRLRGRRHDVGHDTNRLSDLQQHSTIELTEGRVIWGTNIMVREVIAKFRDFIEKFTLDDLKESDNSTSEMMPINNAHGIKHLKESGDLHNDQISSPNKASPLYPRLIQQILDMELTFLNLDCKNLCAYTPAEGLYRQLLTYPHEIIPLMDMVVCDYAKELMDKQSDFPSDDNDDTGLNNINIQVRPYNIGKSVNMRDLEPNNVDQLVSIKGIVIRVSSVIPDMRSAYFKCTMCNHGTMVDNIRGRVVEPQRCNNESCGALKTMTIQHNLCIYSDKQILKIQETPDEIPDGQTPHTVTCCVYDSLVDLSRAGDRAEITGIYRVVPIRVNHHQRKVRNIFRTYLDIVHIKRTAEGRLIGGNDSISSNELQTMELDRLIEDDEASLEEIINLSRRPDLYQILSNSIAPSICGMDTVKKSILLQLFGGVGKKLDKYGKTTLRGDIHVLITGDPSMSKSQLLSYAHRIAPRGIYTSGKGSSSVGLTAYITRDHETGQIALESGALVLSDGGICCIDEFDKMNDSTRAILHEVMEQQTISVAKVGIITTLNARTSILAAANPIDSKYNPKKSIVENINLPPSLLSRFDIICLALDTPNEELDANLAHHIVSLYVEGRKPKENIINPDLLARYISYARANYNPVLTSEAMEKLIEEYVKMRRVNNISDDNNGNKTISATVRQLESLIRLSEAHARMRLSETVIASDVDAATNLVRSAILSYALDPITGRIDMGMVTTGKSESYRDLLELIKKEILKHMEASASHSSELNTIIKEIMVSTSKKCDDKVIKDAILDLIIEEKLYAPLPLKGNPIIQKTF